MGAALSGTMRTVITKAAEHATARVQFGSRIDSYGAIQEKLARMSMIHYATESMAYMVSGTMDREAYIQYICNAVSSLFLSHHFSCCLFRKLFEEISLSLTQYLILTLSFSLDTQSIFHSLTLSL